MAPFSGFSEKIFEHCEPSEKIRVPINALKELELEIEPALKVINSALGGHVSRTKKKGTNEYYDWAWLYFNTVGTGAYRYSQLTVNISPTRLYVGINIKTYPEYFEFRQKIQKEDASLFEEILKTLSVREWIISIDDYWERQTPRRYSIQELRGILDYRFYWINACFEKNDPILRTRKIADEITQIFKEFYNIYALASGNQTISQPDPKYGVFEQQMLVDTAESPPKSDGEIASEIKHFISTLETTKKSGEYHLPKRRDQYSIKRTALELKLKPYVLECEGKTVTIYSNDNIRLHEEILRNYSEFSKRIDKINELLQLPEGFLKVMYVNPKSDARYHKIDTSKSIFLNLARFENNKSLFFWVFSVSRELAYIRAHRLGYRFVNQLRDIMTVALTSVMRT